MPLKKRVGRSPRLQMLDTVGGLQKALDNGEPLDPTYRAEVRRLLKAMRVILEGLKTPTVRPPKFKAKARREARNESET